VSGVSDGEKVVTRANFLVDSESRLRASLAALAGNASQPAPAAASGGGSDGKAAGADPHAGHGR
jgi:membrane fusion protein, copper/silver efflux system